MSVRWAILYGQKNRILYPSSQSSVLLLLLLYYTYISCWKSSARVYIYASSGSSVIVVSGPVVWCEHECARVRRRARESCIYIIKHIKEKKGPMRFLFLLRSTRILSRAKIRRTFGAFPASGWHIPSEFHVIYIYLFPPFSPARRRHSSHVCDVSTRKKKSARTQWHTSLTVYKYTYILIYIYARARFSLLYTMTIYMTRPRAVQSHCYDN